MNSSNYQTPRLLAAVTMERFKAAFKPGPIALQPFNVLIGRNGSGKSTLVEALQWLDTTIRRDAREASDRYFGVRDLINLRTRPKPPYFQLTLLWSAAVQDPDVAYVVRVEDVDGNPLVASEYLSTFTKDAAILRRYVSTNVSGHRVLSPESGGELVFQEPDRLSLALLAGLAPAPDSPISFLPDFWERAVFLRLSPTRLAYGSPAKRKSFEPLLDEEGQTLPALLNELNWDQRLELVENLQEIIPGIQDIEVSKAETGRDTRVHYSLLELMPHRGRTGRYPVPIPAWMLSEGTRRVTAILALLVRDPPPSLLCIEEIENGLDPWTVLIILRHLQSAADRGTQIILTTHSPWLLDHVPMDTIIQVRRIEGDTKYEHFASRPEILDYSPAVPAGTRYVNEAD